MKKKNFAHILLLIGGGLALISTAFHENVWFDETYTIALVRQSFPEMFAAGIADVHPMLYYILLKIYSLAAGTSIIALRLFSVIGAQLLAILGFTHIRKDFGEKIGFWYSFIIYFTAAVFRYTAEIRMYTWLPLFVTLCAIYGYRLFQKTESVFPVKETLLFTIFGLCAAYTQYFGLVTVCVINAALLIALFIKKHKTTAFAVAAALQILLYIPGFYVLMQQIKNVSGGYWINVAYPDILFQTLSFFFVGDTPDSSAMFTTPQSVQTAIVIISCILFIFCIFQIIRAKAKPAVVALIIFFGMTAVGLVVSAFIQIFYVRYCMACAGLIAFAFASAASEIKFKYGKQAFSAVMLCCFLSRAIPLYETVYSPENEKPLQFIENNLTHDDILLIEDNLSVASVLAVQNPNIKIYILVNKSEYLWQKAYDAYQPQISMISSLQDLPQANNIWILETQDDLTGKKETFITPYHNLRYTFSLLKGGSGET